MPNYRSLVPVMTGYTDKSTGITVSASSEKAANGYRYPIYSAFDGKISGYTNYIYHYWETAHSNPYCIIDFNKNRYCVRRFSIASAKAHQPISINIQASNDHLNWKSIYDIKNFETIKDGVLQNYDFDNKRYFRYYKINFIRSSGMYVYEMQLYEDMDFEHPRYLIKQDSNYYTVKTKFYQNGQYKPLTLEGGTTPNNSDFLNNGFEDLNDLILNEYKEGIIKSAAIDLGEGKMFEFNIDSEFNHINKIEMKDGVI